MLVSSFVTAPIETHRGCSVHLIVLTSIEHPAHIRHNLAQGVPEFGESQSGSLMGESEGRPSFLDCLQGWNPAGDGMVFRGKSMRVTV